MDPAQVELRSALLLDVLRPAPGAEEPEHAAGHQGDPDEDDLGVWQLRLGRLPRGLVDQEEEGPEECPADHATDRALERAVVLETREVAAHGGHHAQHQIGRLVDAQRPPDQRPEGGRHDTRQDCL